MNDWSGEAGYTLADGVCDATMVILPPKFRDIEMGPLGAGQGAQAVYSGQGNNMNRFLARTFDLSAVPADEPVVMSLDAWFVIEAEWDYLYVEVAGVGEPFGRIMPMDKSAIDDEESAMPSGKGHEGAGSVPGFTGRSGDLDGDGKVEGAAGCDPSADRTLAEDSVGSATTDPCEVAQWIEAAFDLSGYRGREVTVRFTYFTDMAAVEDGAMLDNFAIPAIGFVDDFEGPDLAASGFRVGVNTRSRRATGIRPDQGSLARLSLCAVEYVGPVREFASVEISDRFHSPALASRCGVPN